ncbi:hypothetical protein ACVXG8_01075 [Escherichia coli]
MTVITPTGRYHSVTSPAFSGTSISPHEMRAVCAAVPSNSSS